MAQAVIPPDPPSLLPQQGGGAGFSVQKNVVDTRQELKLIIEFPLSRNRSGNDIAMFYKRFMTVLFAASRDLQLLKWEGGNENPITVAADIAWDKDTIGKFYSGMKRNMMAIERLATHAYLPPILFGKLRGITNFSIGYRLIRSG